jgi:ribulose bisphosphate carboxylase small subunit
MANDIRELKTKSGEFARRTRRHVLCEVQECRRQAPGWLFVSHIGKVGNSQRSSMQQPQTGAHFEVSLRIRHPNASPEEITRQLSWQPKFCYKAGERRTTPKGNLLSGYNKESFWLVELPIEADDTIATVIGRANCKLEQSRDYVRQLVTDGGGMEYFIGWFVDNNCGEVFDWPLLQQCADLRVQLGFDVYGRK